MFFAWDILIPANTLESAPIEQYLRLSKGVITSVSVKFPAGCQGVVKVRFLHAEFQLVPISKGEWVTGDDEEVETETYYELDGIPYALKFIGNSPGTSNSHTLQVRISVQPADVASLRPFLNLFTRFLKKIGLGGKV